MIFDGTAGTKKIDLGVILIGEENSSYCSGKEKNEKTWSMKSLTYKKMLKHNERRARRRLRYKRLTWKKPDNLGSRNGE